MSSLLWTVAKSTMLCQLSSENSVSASGIRDTLWNELPACYDELSISAYRQRIYEYVYTRYKDVA